MPKNLPTWSSLPAQDAAIVKEIEVRPAAEAAAKRGWPFEHREFGDGSVVAQGQHGCARASELALVLLAKDLSARPLALGPIPR